MTKRSAILRLGTVIPVALMAACTAVGTKDRTVSPVPSSPDSATESAAVAPQQRAGALDGNELTIWNTPSFKRRFAESYLAETEVEPTVTADEREVMLEVLDLISADQMAEAADLLRDNVNDASSAVFDFTLANIYYQQDELDPAGEAYRAAVSKHPKFRRAWGNLGQIYFRQGRFEEAMAAFTRVLELGGGDAVTYGLLGVAHAQQGDAVAAEAAFRMATMLAPDTIDWQMGLAETFFKQQRYADAVSLFGELIEDYPDRSELWLAQGEAYARLGKPLEAAENFEVVDRLGGSTADSLSNLGDIYANEQLFDLAVNAYVRAMAKGADGKVDRPLRAAKFMSANGALAETRQLVESIESHHGDHLEENDRKDLLKLRARMAVAEGKGDEEARVLEEIVQIDPLDGDALILLGQHSGRNGDIEKAIFYFERAASIEAFEADAKVRHAQLLVGEGRYKEAVPLLRRAQTLKPRENIQSYMEQVERVAKAH